MLRPVVSVVVPVFRNAATLDELTRDVSRVLEPRGPHEIVLVVDGCPDGSLAVAESLAGSRSTVTCVSLAENIGQHGAVMAGLRRANGHTVVVMDADLQDPPEAVATLIDALAASDHGAVFGDRRGRYDSLPRRLTSMGFKRVMRMVTNGRLPAGAGMFLAMRRSMVDRLLAHAGPEPYVPGLIARSGSSIGSVPVPREPRPSGSSSYSHGARARLAWRALMASRAPADARNRRLAAVAGAAVLFAVILTAEVLRPVGLADESWFLQVVARIDGGEVLYRDVFYGTTPLSVYVAVGMVALLGTHILAVKIISAACYTGVALIGMALVGRLGGGHVSRLAFLGLVLVYANPEVAPGIVFSAAAENAIYTPLALVLMLGCMLVLTGDRAERTDPPLRAVLVAGLLVGLAFSAKQNVGLIAAAAVSAALLLWSPRRRLRPLIREFAVFAGTAASVTIGVLAPVLLTGGGPDLLVYGFTGKTTYASQASYSYADGLAQWWSAFTALRPGAYWLALYPAALIVPPLLILAAARADGHRRRTLTVLLSFVLAGFATMYPSFGPPHLLFAAPVLVLGMVVASSELGRRLPRGLALVARAGLAAWLAIGGAAIAHNLTQYAGARDDRTVDLPRFSGVSVGINADELSSQVRSFRRLADGRPLLLINTHYAGFLYASSGVQNPTPFDYPVVPSFSRDGEQQLSERVVDGSLERVCISSFGYRAPDAVPRMLIATVRRTLKRTDRTPVCTLYEKAP